MWRLAALVSCSLAVVVAGCSRGPDSAARMSPTAPSVSGGVPTGALGGGTSRASAVFPSRADAFDFRRQLETKYATGLGRPLAATAVDPEGDVVWVSEYIRYRVDGCDHGSAVQRVFTEVDGGAAPAVCGASPTGLIAFPPRNETVDFRRLLESKYQAMSRSSLSAVDPEGSAIWIQDYLRYRTNECDHATSVQNVLTQVGGGAAPPVCYVPPVCSFRFSEAYVNVSGEGGSFAVGIYTGSTGADCAWTATSPDPWITFPSGNTGNTAGSLAYVVAGNPGDPRSGSLNLNFPGGSARLPIFQSEPQYNVTVHIIDGARSVNPSTECWVDHPNTKCALTAVANLPNAIDKYDWTVTYFYGSLVTRTEVDSSPTFTITEGCGGPGSTASGTDVDVAVRLMVTDQVGRTATINSGAGRVPALRFRFFTCP